MSTRANVEKGPWNDLRDCLRYCAGHMQWNDMFWAGVQGFALVCFGTGNTAARDEKIAECSLERSVSSVFEYYEFLASFR